MFPVRARSGDDDRDAVQTFQRRRRGLAPSHNDEASITVRIAVTWGSGVTKHPKPNRGHVHKGIVLRIRLG